MTQYDIFNGDADGICAIQQLRLATPCDDAVIITGVKRDIALVKQVKPVSGDRLTVLDISLDKNLDGVQAALDAGASVEYYDHHFAGDIPQHEKFDCQINTAKDTCTSLIVNGTLNGAHMLWAIAGAFGDNFEEPARALAKQQELSEAETDSLKQLGEAINYNAYGATLEDLHITPQALVKKIRPYASPLDFLNNDPVF